MLKNTDKLSVTVLLGGIAAAIAFRVFYRSGCQEKKAKNTTEVGKVWKIVLTGGPCGGKSSALKSIMKEMESLHINVWSVPEIATTFMLGGLTFTPELVGNPTQMALIQSAMMRAQIQMEDNFEACARAMGGNAVIVCDRGACDAKAYCTPSEWVSVLASIPITEAQLLARYDGVLHLVSAAHGAEKFYTLENNATRTETPQMARDLDDRVRSSYISHKRLCVIDNSTGFPDKLKRIVAGLKGVIGK